VCESVDRSVASIRSRWYQQQIDVKSAKSLLEETAECFRQYTTLSNTFFIWLPEAEQVLYHRANEWQVGTSSHSLFACYCLLLWMAVEYCYFKLSRHIRASYDCYQAFLTGLRVVIGLCVFCDIMFITDHRYSKFI